MPNDVAFLPWVSVREPIAIGPLRLLPYARGAKPGDLPNAVQTDLDAILSAYADRPGYSVQMATILELEPWRTGMDSSEHMPALFRTRAFMGFAALARRKLFASHFGYTNYDTFFLSIQRYNPGKASSFSFTTRRRDGATHHMWSADHFAFQRPSHVDSRARVELDLHLLETLLDMGDSHPWVGIEDDGFIEVAAEKLYPRPEG